VRSALGAVSDEHDLAGLRSTKASAKFTALDPLSVGGPPLGAWKPASDTAQNMPPLNVAIDESLNCTSAVSRDDVPGRQQLLQPRREPT